MFITQKHDKMFKLKNVQDNSGFIPPPPFNHNTRLRNSVGTYEVHTFAVTTLLIDWV